VRAVSVPNPHPKHRRSLRLRRRVVTQRKWFCQFPGVTGTPRLRRRVVTQQMFFRLFFCDRPGCYELPQKSVRNPACYCGRACGEAVRRVLDRERKWQSRGTLQGRCKRASEYQAAHTRRCQQRHDAASAPLPRASSP
jgi:hypothetical protein